VPSILSIIVIASIILSKYFNKPTIYLLIIILVSILYQLNINKRSDKEVDLEDKLINLSKFIIITGVAGYIVVRIIGLFLPDFN
jgi:hypothetical protein